MIIWFNFPCSWVNTEKFPIISSLGFTDVNRHLSPWSKHKSVIYWSPSPVTTVLKMPAHLFPHPHGCLGHPPTKSHVAQDDILTAPFASSLAPSLSISHDAAGGAYKTNFTTVPLKYLLTSPSPTKYGPNSQDSNLSLLYWTSHSPNRLNSSLSNKWKPQPP